MIKNTPLENKDIFFIVFGNMLGVGVFLTPYYIANQVSNPGEYLLVWIIASVGALSGGIAYASLAKHFPVNGGDYIFLQHFWGKIVAYLFFICMFLFAFPGTMAILASGTTLYIKKILILNHFPGSFPSDLLTVMIIVAFFLFNLSKIKLAILNQKVIVILVLLLIMAVFMIICTGNPNELNFKLSLNISGSGVLKGILFGYFSFIGFASVAYVAGDIREKEKNLSIPVLIAVLLITAIYLILNSLYLAGVPWHVLQSDKASVFALIQNSTPFYQTIVYFLLILAALSSLNVLFITGGRLFEFIFSDIYERKISDTKIFNKSLVFITALGILFTITHTFEEILNTTTWVILFFSSLTASGFVKYIYQRKLPVPMAEKILIIGFAVFSFVIALTGMIEFIHLFFKGFLYIIAGFFIFYILILKRK
jgi:amino acid transporter